MKEPVSHTKERAGIARVMCEIGLWEEMLEFAQRWRECDPFDYQALHYIGLVLSALGQFAMAETAYRGALELFAFKNPLWPRGPELGL